MLKELSAEDFVFVVVMLDEPLHTAENGYTCDDPTCPCHEDMEPVCLDSNCACQESKPVTTANYRRLNSDDFIPEYPCLPQETTWYEC
ncbi:MAG: hypothetical protein ACJ788_05590 [Ktedonobacteraceae bacterium]